MLCFVRIIVSFVPHIKTMFLGCHHNVEVVMEMLEVLPTHYDYTLDAAGITKSSLKCQTLLVHCERCGIIFMTFFVSIINIGICIYCKLS